MLEKRHPPAIEFRATALGYPAAAQEVDDQYHQRYDQQQVDQTSSHVEAEAKKPHNQKYYEDSPKHVYLLRSFVELLILALPLSVPLGMTFHIPSKTAWTVG